MLVSSELGIFFFLLSLSHDRHGSYYKPCGRGWYLPVIFVVIYKFIYISSSSFSPL